VSGTAGLGALGGRSSAATGWRRAEGRRRILSAGAHRAPPVGGRPPKPVNQKQSSSSGVSPSGRYSEPPVSGDNPQLASGERTTAGGACCPGRASSPQVGGDQRQPASGERLKASGACPSRGGASSAAFPASPDTRRRPPVRERLKGDGLHSCPIFQGRPVSTTATVFRNVATNRRLPVMAARFKVVGRQESSTQRPLVVEACRVGAGGIHLPTTLRPPILSKWSKATRRMGKLPAGRLAAPPW